MNTYEQRLFLQLCRPESFDRDIMAALLPQYADAEVLGQLFFNRMQGVAYTVLQKAELIGRVHREFSGSLRGAYEQNVERNKSYLKCLRLLSGALRDCAGRYAALKGARLCLEYPRGCRTSNDVDILVSGEDITRIGRALSAAGFRQGWIRDGRFDPASRAQIVESRMLRGETVPYILEVGLPYMRFLEVDVNFSMDYKNGSSDVVSRILADSVQLDLGGCTIPVPSRHDFFIHLCAHLYKEMTALPWVRMRRDMSMYKFCDIYMLVRRFNCSDADFMFARAEELGLQAECCCAVLWTDALLPVKGSRAAELARQKLKGRQELLHTVVAPSEKTVYVYEDRDVASRFFSPDRTALLREVKE